MDVEASTVDDEGKDQTSIVSIGICDIASNMGIQAQVVDLKHYRSFPPQVKAQKHDDQFSSSRGSAKSLTFIS